MISHLEDLSFTWRAKGVPCDLRPMSPLVKYLIIIPKKENLCGLS